LRQLSEQYDLKGERGEGLLRALTLNKDIGPKIVEAARELEPVGLLLNSPRPNLIRFMPALNIEKEEIDLMISMLSEILGRLKNDI
jgi:acetylornithine/N-succinyldiaminopimelate aminotransferase